MTERLFCPPDCGLLKDKPKNCDGCHHASDVPFSKPIKYMAWRDHWIDANIVGKNDDWYYVKEGESVCHVGFGSKLIR
jgi:hypothetical protein